MVPGDRERGRTGPRRPDPRPGCPSDDRRHPGPGARPGQARLGRSAEVKYLYLLYADESQAPAPGSPEMERQGAAYDAYYHDVAERGLFQSGEPVQPSATATTVRVRDGATQTLSG